MKEIGDNAFSNWSSLEEVVFEGAPRKIGRFAFWYTNLGNITIREGLLEIGEHAFAASGVNLSLPNTVQNIEYAAFHNNGEEDKLCDVTFPNGMNDSLESQINSNNLWEANSITVVENGSTTTYNKQ